jgi:hypothetical protein
MEDSTTWSEVDEARAKAEEMQRKLVEAEAEKARAAAEVTKKAAEAKARAEAEAAKAKAAAIRADTTGESLVALNRLFNACSRIQAEASLAAGRHIPLVIENVRGAQPWVGRARWNFGSFYLWGDVPALMPAAVKAQKFNPDGTAHPPGSWFAIADSKNRGSSGQKVPGFRFDGSGKSFQTASVKDTFGWAKDSPVRCNSSSSSARKQASAMIAKSPLILSRHIAATYRA